MYCVYGNSGRYIHGGPLFGGDPLLGGSVIGGSTVYMHVAHVSDSSGAHTLAEYINFANDSEIQNLRN